MKSNNGTHGGPAAPERLVPFADVYDAVVLQVVGEKRSGGLRNLRSYALHVVSREVYAIPRTVDYREYGQFACMSILMSTSEFAALAFEMDQGRARIGSHEISFALNPAYEGFQPDAVLDYSFAEPSLINRSAWSRVRTSNDKVVGTTPLSDATLPKLADALSFLHINRWHLLDLTEYPEKLGEFDEVWPSPVWEFRHDGNLHIADPYTLLTGRRIELRAQIWIGGLLRDSLVFEGIGPHSLPSNIDALELELFVDGLLLDKSASTLIRRLELSMGVAAPRSLRMSRSGRRQGLTVPVAPRTTSVIRIGERPSSTEPAFRDLGRRWRDQHASWKTSRFERIYDPRNSDSVKRAFSDIQSLSRGRRANHIIVVDRYSIDRDALETIAAVTASYPSGLTLDIVTKFDESTPTPSANPIVGTPHPTGSESGLPARVARFRSAVEFVSRELDVHIRVYHALGIDIHDRFLCIDERIWHIGPSLNALGESLSAIVEMGDIRALAELRNVLETLLHKKPLIEVGTRA